MNSEKLHSNFIKVIFPFCLVFMISTTLAQPFQIGHATITFTDSSRDNREIETEIYYPADVAGDNVALTASDSDQFPVLAFGHGFLMGYTAYQYLWEELVPEGFVMIFPTTEGGLLPSHSDYGKDIAFAINGMAGLSLLDTSIFFNRINDYSAAMGHSMGGGAAFLAAGNDSGIDALLTLAPAETNPSAIGAAGGLAIPSLIFAGANDCVTPPISNQLPMYESLQSACKTYISIIGGSHCQMADSNFFCGIGEATCSPQPGISREVQHQTITDYIGVWLKSQLKNDCAAGTLFDTGIVSDSAITYLKTCLQCEPLSVVAMQNPKIPSVYPNPFDDVIHIIFENDDAEKQITVYDMYSRKLMEKMFTGSVTINSTNWNSGIFFYTIADSNNSILSKGKLVKN